MGLFGSKHVTDDAAAALLADELVSKLPRSSLEWLWAHSRGDPEKRREIEAAMAADSQYAHILPLVRTGHSSAVGVCGGGGPYAWSAFSSSDPVTDGRVVSLSRAVVSQPVLTKDGTVGSVCWYASSLALAAELASHGADAKLLVDARERQWHPHALHMLSRLETALGVLADAPGEYGDIPRSFALRRALMVRRMKQQFAKTGKAGLRMTMEAAANVLSGQAGINININLPAAERFMQARTVDAGRLTDGLGDEIIDRIEAIHCRLDRLQLRESECALRL